MCSQTTDKSGKAGMKCPVCGKMICAKKDMVCNSLCPMTGNKIDPEKVPTELTRMWKGKKVGFCCAGCPAQWDKLSDKQKQKKLDAAMEPAEDK